LAVEPASSHREWVKNRREDYLWGNRIQMLSGSILPAQAYYKAQKLRAMLRQEVLDALASYDVLVLPTVGKTAQDIESFSQGTLMRRPYLLTSTFNLANAPAISIPCGFSESGLPIGLQIGAKPGADETVLRVAHAYEQNTDWHNRRPPTV
jgi:aspartyl-tRNA(Asn)/glutamyl-tRNA(Gln) amidotransferase subunit A